MQNFCGDCLSKDVCDITGASCKKMDALVNQRKLLNNGRTTIMSNTPKNVTPKTVADKAAEPQTVEEKTVPAQATEPKVETTEPQDGEKTKPSLVQRLKTKVERLDKNKKAIIALAVSAAVFGVVVNNKRRKAVAVELLDPTDTSIIGVGEDASEDDETTGEA
jgi:hypothetical protein